MHEGGVPRPLTAWTATEFGTRGDPPPHTHTWFRAPKALEKVHPGQVRGVGDRINPFPHASLVQSTCLAYKMSQVQSPTSPGITFSGDVKVLSLKPWRAVASRGNSQVPLDNWKVACRRLSVCKFCPSLTFDPTPSGCLC